MAYTVKKTVRAEQLSGIITLPRNFQGKTLRMTVEVEEPSEKDAKKREEAIKYFAAHPIKSNTTLEEGREERFERYEALG